MRYGKKIGFVIWMFQFQDGSIKWAIYDLIMNRFITFQFQDGSIKCILGMYGSYDVIIVSIPRWFD